MNIIKKLLHKKTVICSILYSYAMFLVDHNLWSTTLVCGRVLCPSLPSLITRDGHLFSAKKSHLALSRHLSLSLVISLSLVLYVMTTTNHTTTT